MKYIKEFIKNEKKITKTVSVAIIFCILFIATSNIKEMFILGAEIMSFLYAISLSIIAATIFYIFQIYIPSLKISKIAKKELITICSNIIGTFRDIFISCSTKNEIEYFKIKELNNFLSPVVSLQISTHFNLETEANISPKMNWNYRLSILGKEIREKSESISKKYSPYISEEFHKSIHKLSFNRGTEFLRILDNMEILEFHKVHNKRTVLHKEIIEELFKLIIEINEKHNLKLTFSPITLKSQKGIRGKSRHQDQKNKVE